MYSNATLHHERFIIGGLSRDYLPNACLIYWRLQLENAFYLLLFPYKQFETTCSQLLVSLII